MNAFTERLRSGQPTLMLAVRSSRTADVVRIAAATGHHAVMLDLEHSTMSLDVAASLAATATDLGLFAFARVPDREYGAIGRLLDGGVSGIIAPRVETAAEAAAIARATSATQTGWNFTTPRSTGTKGAACSAANRFRKPSSWPNTTEGQTIVASGKAARTATSPSPLLRP